jgi:hypothetical protein
MHTSTLKKRTQKNLSGKLNTWSVTFKTFIDMVDNWTHSQWSSKHLQTCLVGTWDQHFWLVVATINIPNDFVKSLQFGKINRVIIKSCDQGARTASFYIIGHQMCTVTGNENFTKRNNYWPKLVFPPILVINWVSSCLSFFMSASTAATYILSLCLITLKPCALNAEFQHSILRFNKVSLLCWYHWKRR